MYGLRGPERVDAAEVDEPAALDVGSGQEVHACPWFMSHMSADQNCHVSWTEAMVPAPDRRMDVVKRAM